MERHKNLGSFTGFLSCLLLFLSCSTSAPVTTESEQLSNDTDLTKAMVVDQRELDGCTYILILEDGTRLEPVELPESFRKDSLEVMIKYADVKQPSICMIGRMVNIIEIKTRSEQ